MLPLELMSAKSDADPAKMAPNIDPFRRDNVGASSC